MFREQFEHAMRATSIGELMKRFRLSVSQREPLEETKMVDRLGDPKPDRSAPKDQGPMIYLGHQICKRMEQIGYPSKIAVGYRTPEQQDREFRANRSNAKGWQSPHQFYLAVDICHKFQGWPKDTDPYWDALMTVVANVEADYAVKLTAGKRDWGWDFAHVQLRDWKGFRERCKGVGGAYHRPTPTDLYAWFREVLPKVSYPVPDSLSVQAQLDEVDAAIKSGEMGTVPQLIRPPRKG